MRSNAINSSCISVLSDTEGLEHVCGTAACCVCFFFPLFLLLYSMQMAGRRPAVRSLWRCFRSANHGGTRWVKCMGNNPPIVWQRWHSWWGMSKSTYCGAAWAVWLSISGVSLTFPRSQCCGFKAAALFLTCKKKTWLTSFAECLQFYLNKINA